jgi:hypothetical protein
MGQLDVLLFQYKVGPSLLQSWNAMIKCAQQMFSRQKIYCASSNSIELRSQKNIYDQMFRRVPRIGRKNCGMCTGKLFTGGF